MNSAALHHARCVECNARVQTIRKDEDGQSYLYPCGHPARFVAALVNRGDQVPLNPPDDRLSTLWQVGL